MSQLLTVALAQYPSGRDCMEIVAAAKAAAAEIVVFPEMYSNGYACFDPNDPAAEARWCAETESLEGDFVGRFREAAKAHRVHVVSTFLERAEPKPFNAALLIDPGGHSLLHHRKVHICDFDSPELACGRGSEFAACDIETVAGRVLACSAVLPQHFEKLRASSGWGGLAHPPRNTSAL
jgi:predicted amidohydrolase